jgi:hypothetical protein
MPFHIDPATVSVPDLHPASHLAVFIEHTNLKYPFIKPVGLRRGV